MRRTTVFALMILTACSMRPDVAGPALVDNADVVESWKVATGSDLGAMPSNADDVLVQDISSDAVRLVWMTLQCQTQPVVSLESGPDNALEVHLWRGEIPGDGCEAAGAIWAFEMVMARPIPIDQFEIVDHGD